MYKTIISTKELSDNLENPNWVVVDCRFSMAGTDSREKGRADYKLSHIPGAVYAHLDDDLAAPVVPGKTGRHPLPSVEETSEMFSKWGIDGNVQVVVYDDNIGAFAGRLWWMLRWLGHEAVALLDGGWERWKKDGLRESSDIPTRAARTFVPKVQAQLLMDVNGVRQWSENGNGLIVDSRSEERYTGEKEHIDSLAGHVPGAVNRPFRGNIGEDGLMRPASELAEYFRELLGRNKPDETVFYCGSGVTACHNLIAMKHAGLGDGKLYPGSWSDWITDPERRVSGSGS